MSTSKNTRQKLQAELEGWDEEFMPRRHEYIGISDLQM